MEQKNAITPLQPSLSPSPPSPRPSPTPRPSPPLTSRSSPPRSVCRGSPWQIFSRPVELADQPRLCVPYPAWDGGHDLHCCPSCQRKGCGGMTHPLTHPWPCRAWSVALSSWCLAPCRRSGTCPSPPSWMPRSVWGWPPGILRPRGCRWPGWPAARLVRPPGP